MSAESDDDVKVPSRRRRASDDEAEEAEFHDAAEYAASVAESHATVDRVDRGAVEPRSEGGDDEDHGPVGEATGEEEVTETEEALGDQGQADELAADRKKAKLREPFEVPTSGAFWLHDDRFGGEEPQAAEPPRNTGGAWERKARSDTEGRWLHDKFTALESGAAADDDSDNAFATSYNRRGRGGRGMRGRRGGRAGDGLGGRGRGISTGRVRDGRYDAGSADGSAEAPPGLGESQEALPQRQPRAPRSSTRSSGGFQGTHEDDAGPASGAAASHAFFGAGRGRGQGIRGGRSGEFSGRGRSERSFSPEGGNREDGSGAEYGGPGGRGRGAAGRGRGRDDVVLGRGGYANGGRGAGRGYGRRPDTYDREAGLPAPYSSNGDDFDGGRARGRGPGRSGDFQGRGSGPGGRGSAPGGGRGMTQRQPPHQQPRRLERAVDDEFPPLPGRSGAVEPLVSLTLSAAEPRQQQAGGSAADTGAPPTQGVRRYSKMAGKVAGGATGGDAGGDAATGSEAGRLRGGAGEGGGGGARVSKLSAAAPTFEPSPATTGRQQQHPPAQHQAPPPKPQQPVPSVPVAFGAPLQPMTVVTTTQNQPPPPQPQPPSAQPLGSAPEPYGGPVPPPHGQQMAYVPQHQQQQPPPHVPQGGQAQGYIPVPQQASIPPPQPQPPPQPLPPQPPPLPGSAMAPQGMQQQYGSSGGGGMYGTSIADMEAWYQDAYQKARATGMDPQQAYSAVQGYVQGMQMAFQHFNMQTQAQAAQQQQQHQQQQQQHWAGYAGVPPMMQGSPPPPGP